jgi:ribonuclease HI
MTSSLVGAVLAAACAEYVKDKIATLDEFDRIVQEARYALTDERTRALDRERREERNTISREGRRRRKLQRQADLEYARKHNIKVEDVAKHQLRKVTKTLDDLAEKAAFADQTIEMVRRAGELRPGKAELAAE